MKNRYSENIFFTSDHHFYHKNVIEYCNRPFESVWEMNETMINRWNEKVGKNDTVFELGDMFPFCSIAQTEKILSQLNGNIISLKGNHFNSKCINIFPNIKYFDILEIEVEDPDAVGGWQKIELCHYPFLRWNHQHKNSWDFYGHTHATLLETLPNQLHVGVDDHDFYPLSYKETKSLITERQYES